MRALFLDLDGTLIHRAADEDLFWARRARERGVLSAAEDAARGVFREAYRAFWRGDRTRMGTDMLGAWAQISREACRELGAAAEAAQIEPLVAEFAEYYTQNTRLFPETLDVLRTLRERGVRLALVTNGDPRVQRAKIRRHALAPWFDAILIEGEAGVGKPDPAIFRQALAALGAAPSEAWMVGDDLEVDIPGAQQAGVRGAWLDRGGKGVWPGCRLVPDRIIRQLTEVLQLHDY